MFLVERKKRIFCIGLKKDFPAVVNLEKKYCLDFYSSTELITGLFPCRPDMFLISIDRNVDEYLLAFRDNNAYVSVPVICLISRGTAQLSLLKNGVTDCLVKPVTPTYLEAKIDSIFALISRYLVTYHTDFENFRTYAKSFPKPEEFPLTGVEKKVLELVLKGLSNKEIAGNIYISEGTVKNHLTRIYSKCGVRSRYELISLFLTA